MKALTGYVVFLFGLPLVISFTHDDTSKLYIIALREHVLREEKGITSESERKEFASAPIFIINDCGIELPKELGSHKLQELGDSASMFVNNASGLHAIKLNPISIDRGKAVVILSDYVVTKGIKEARFAYGGGREYVFSYDAKSQQYAIVQTKAISF
jgi:hypothetical protein